MSKPILTGKQVRAIRDKLDLTQEELATELFFNGPTRRMRISKIETGIETIDEVRANLLLAMAAGYKVVHVPHAKAG